MNQRHQLSKSTFMKGCQCPKALYLNKHHRQLKDEVSDAQQSIFDRGTRVGELATQLFPNGKDASPPTPFDYPQSVAMTQQLINDGIPIIYEACFQYDRVLAALDILVYREGQWHAYEVKSSTSVSETYELDAALQYYVITQSGLPLASISIVHLNNQYERKGKLDTSQLFTTTDITTEVLALQQKVQVKIPELKKVLEQSDPPQMDIGKHCNSPYACDFQGHCWAHIPEERSVFALPYARGKDWELYGKGILSLEEVPEDYPLNEKHRQQIDGYRTGEIQLDKMAMGQFLNEVTYPLYFFDFETIQPAVPIWDGSRPYQQVAFQYSLHYQGKKGGALEHVAYLAATDGADPRIALMEQLERDANRPGDIWVYNIGFERARLKEMGRDLPQFSAMAEGLAGRLKDLMVPFQKRHYYTPDMDGRYSIKNVLPALVPELTYSALDIQEGGTASRTFLAMIQGHFKGDIETTRKHLLDYCELDTLAMVRILEKLYELELEPMKE